MPLLFPRLSRGRGRGTTATAAPKSTPARAVLRKTPVGRTIGPTPFEPRQLLQQRMNQLGTDFTPGPGRPAPTVTTGLYIPRPGDGIYERLQERARQSGQQAPTATPSAPVKEAIGAGASPSRAGTGGGFRRPATGVFERAQRQFGIDPRRDMFGGRRFGSARSARSLLRTGRLAGSSGILGRAFGRLGQRGR